MKFIIFADDTNMFLSSRNLDYLVNTINKELRNLVIWFQANKLSLNVDKTNFMVFSSNCKKSNKCNIQIKINDINIERVSYTKFLGVLLDENLSWCEHIRSIENKISRNIGILYKCNKILDSVHLLYLYNSLVLPYLNYCAVIWGNNKKCRLTTLTCLQKKAVRCIAKVGFKDHTSPKFSIV